MGTRGAAIATVTGQIIAMLLGLYFNLTKNKDVQFHFKFMKLESNSTQWSVFRIDRAGWFNDHGVVTCTVNISLCTIRRNVFAWCDSTAYFGT